ncbi:MAG: alanine racemase [Oscillospiraceae bacterium]|jgi:alanine racemase|nr:alanine racemase [Bacillota bacterium]
MESTLKRTWAEISLDNLTHNFETIRRQVGPKAKLLGVVKADAYGHGAVRVAKHLERLGAGYLAVSNLDECEELRVNGITLPILMLGFTPADQAGRILKNDMTQAVPNLAIAEAYSSAAVHAGGTMKVHIKLDTGMGRLGFQCDDAHFDASLRDILKILALPGLDVEGVFTHFCVSDEAADECVEFTKVQHNRFLRMIDAVETQGNFRFRLHHCCNAGGIASYPEWAWDMVRCGIILYGTGDLAERMGMKPVMTVKTTVSTIKDFDPDTSISYGRQFFTTRPSRIAVLPIGYADGLFRALSGKLRVLTPYGEAQQVGRICMDMCMIDVTDLPQLKVGDEIEVFGEHQLIETAAKQCGTISYELLCAVSKRVPRYYYLGGKCVDRNLQLLG